jgi:hypothetical protein
MAAAVEEEAELQNPAPSLSDEDNPFSFLAGTRERDSGPFGFFFSFESTGLYEPAPAEPPACPLPAAPEAIEVVPQQYVPALPTQTQREPTLEDTQRAPIARLFGWFSSNQNLTPKQARRGFVQALIDRTPGARQFFEAGDGAARRACKYLVTGFALATWQQIKHQVAALSTMTGLTWMACNSWAHVTGYATKISLAGAGSVVFGVAGGVSATYLAYAGWTIVWPMLFQLAQAGGLQLLLNAFKAGGGEGRRAALESPLLPKAVRDWLKEQAPLLPDWLYAASREDVIKFLLNNFSLYMLSARNIEEGFVSQAALKEFMLVKAFGLTLQQLSIAVQGLRTVPSDYRELKRRLESLFEANRQETQRVFDTAGVRLNDPYGGTNALHLEDPIHALLQRFQQDPESAFAKYRRANPDATEVPVSVFNEDAERLMPMLNQAILQQARAAVQRMEQPAIPLLLQAAATGGAAEQLTQALSNELELQTSWQTWMLVGGSTALGLMMAVAGNPAAAIQMASDALGLAGVKLLESTPVQHAFRWGVSAATQGVKQVLYSFLAQQIGLQQYVDRMVNWVAASRIQQARALDIEIQKLAPGNPQRNRLIGLLIDRVVLKIRSHADIDRMPRAELLQIWRERAELPADNASLVRFSDEQIRKEIKDLQLGANRVTYGMLLASAVRIMGKAGGGLIVRAAMSKQADQWRDATLGFLANKASVAAAGIQDAGAGALRAVLEQGSQVYDFAKLNSVGAHWPFTGKVPETIVGPLPQSAAELAQQDAWRLAAEAAAKVDDFVGKQAQSLADQTHQVEGVSIARPPASSAFAVAQSGSLKTSPAPLFAAPAVSVEQAFRLTQTPVLQPGQTMLDPVRFLSETTETVTGKRAWDLLKYRYTPVADYALLTGAKLGTSTTVSGTAPLAGVYDQYADFYNRVGQTTDGLSRFAAVAKALDKQFQGDAPVPEWSPAPFGVRIPSWRAFAPDKPYNHVNLPNSAMLLSSVEDSLRVELRDEFLLAMVGSNMNPKTAMQTVVKRALGGQLVPSAYNWVRFFVGGASLDSIRYTPGTRVSLTAQDQLADAGQKLLEALTRGEVDLPAAPTQEQMHSRRRKPPRCKHCLVQDAIGKKRISGKGYVTFCSIVCGIAYERRDE